MYFQKRYELVMLLCHRITTVASSAKGYKQIHNRFLNVMSLKIVVFLVNVRWLMNLGSMLHLINQITFVVEGFFLVFSFVFIIFFVNYRYMIMTNDMYMNIEMWVKNKREKRSPAVTLVPIVITCTLNRNSIS